MLLAASYHRMQGLAQKPCAIGHGPPIEVEYASEREGAPPSKRPTPRRASSRARLSSKMASSSTTDVTASLTKSIAASETASFTKSISASTAAQIVANEFFATPPPSDAGEGKLEEIMKMINCEDEDAADSHLTFPPSSDDVESTRPATPSPNDALAEGDLSLAMEVGQNAQAYLEYCFHTEVTVLDREAFNSIPQLCKSDFTILSHLGKGEFSDAFEVVCEGGRLLDAEKNSAMLAQNTGRRSAKGSRSSSVDAATRARPRQAGKPRLVFALKCLRPQIRSDADKFTVGAQDLVHETAILANLDHRHIIKLHGRASGDLTDAFVLNDGYFILLDKLKNMTLQDRLDKWRLDRSLQGPTAKKMQMAHSIADALSYLHSKNIVFRDLKPSNIGFDSMNVLKLFDFGFAIGLPEKDEENPSGYLFDKAGTPRYMAPEVGLSLGYALPSDVYSFGVLLWAICTSRSPFSHVRSSEEFEARVFMGGERPAIESHWPSAIKELMSSCWSGPPSKRPAMEDVKSTVSAAIARGDGEVVARMKAAKSRVARMLTHEW